MAEKTPAHSSKTVLDLALELGVRRETVLSTLQKMGLAVDPVMESIGPGVEKELIQQMVSDGLVSSALQKGKGRRKITGQPLVDDDLVTEALASSESGFNRSKIPHQITFESSFAEKPSFLKRLFGKKNNLVNTIREQEFSEDQINSLFSLPVEKRQAAEVSPFREMDKVQEDVSAKTPAKESPVLSPVLEKESSPVEEETLPDEQDEIEPFNSDGIMDDVGDIDQIGLDEETAGDEKIEGDEEDIESVDEIEDLSGIDDLNFEADDLESLEEHLSGDLAGGEEELKQLPEEETGDKDAKAGFMVKFSLFMERFLSKIQLSQAEVWTLIGGSVAIMLFVLGITVYWWLNYSPESQEKLFAEAMDYFERGEKAEEWKSKGVNLGLAIETFNQFVERYPQNPSIPKAYDSMCQSYYDLAKGYEEAKDQRRSNQYWERVAQMYESYLKYLNETALKQVGPSKENRYLSYPEVSKQKDALFRIAEAYRKLNQHEVALSKLEDFCKNYPDTELALEALYQIGDTHQDLANLNQENESSHLNNALSTYNRILDSKLITPEDSASRMRLYAKMGDIKFRLYNRVASNPAIDSDSYLSEAIAYYELAGKEAHKTDPEKFVSPQKEIFLVDRAKVLKQLADLYLVRGKSFANKWSEQEEAASKYPEGLVFTQRLLDGANKSKQSTGDYINRAQTIYKELLENLNDMKKDKTALEDTLYNNASCYFLMRNYPEMYAAGKYILNSSYEISPLVKAKTNYLMGHSAWEEAKTNQNYAKVKEYYREALRLDPFYPADKNGEESNLAELRLTNVYFLNDRNYEEAAKHFENMLNSYPQSKYTYLTRYWYAKALDQYGDELMDKYEKAESEAKGSAPAAWKSKALTQYENAGIQFANAENVRKQTKVVDNQNEEYLIDIMFSQGHCAFKAGKLKEAETLLTKALDKYRDNPVAQPKIDKATERLGDLNAKLTNYGKAIRLYKDYLDNSFENTNARVSMKLAEAYLNQYSYDNAREWYQRIISEYPPSAEKEITRPESEENPGQKNAGFEAMKKLAKSYHQEANSFSGDGREKKLEQSLESFKKLIQSYPINQNASLYASLSPNEPHVLQEIGNIYYELGSVTDPVNNYKEAVANYKAYLSSVDDPKRKGMVNYRIGQSLMELHRADPLKKSNKTVEDAIAALSNISPSMMDNPIQYADALLLLGQAYQDDALYYQKSGDKELYGSNLEKAVEVFSKVSTTNVTAKVQQANAMRDSVKQILDNQRELATTKP